MRRKVQIFLLLVLACCPGNLALGQPVQVDVTDQLSPEVISLVSSINRTAERLGYRSFRAYAVPDEWAVGKNRTSIVSHGYYMLFGKDSDDSCVNPKGRIGVTILVFIDEEVARRQVSRLQDEHSGNLGYVPIRSDEGGYFVKEINGYYSAIRVGEKVVLLEDRTRAQRDAVEEISEEVRRVDGWQEPPGWMVVAYWRGNAAD